MQKLLLFMIFLILLFALIANPAPASIEITDYILITLSLLTGFFCYCTMSVTCIDNTQYKLLLAIIFYLSYLLISTLMGIMHGIPLLMILRSVGPYINFFPLILLGLIPRGLFNLYAVSLIFIVIGLAQAIYLIYLYFTYAQQAVNTLDVLRNRITFIDPRTTLPMLYGLAILPIMFIIEKNNLKKRKIFSNFFSAGLILIGLFAGMLTLTRSIILSLLAGWLIFVILYVNQIYHQNENFFPLLNKLLLYTVGLLIVILAISYIPKIHMMESGLITRFYDSSATMPSDYSNGRLHDEWLPALKTWVSGSKLSLLFGMGAGKSFIVLNGEERTYTHNLCIYSLVYGGFYGLFACILLYYSTFKSLIVLHLQTKHPAYLVFSALLFSLFFYAQFFAIHKGLAFNAMLFIIVALALHSPIKKWNN